MPILMLRLGPCPAQARPERQSAAKRAPHAPGTPHDGGVVVGRWAGGEGHGLLRETNSDTNRITIDADWPVNPFHIRKDTKRIMKRSQLRAARALLEWSQERLAEASGISVPTIKRMEPGDGPMTGRFETVDALRRALEAAGVTFVEENGDGPGVRLRKKSMDQTIPSDADPEEIVAHPSRSLRTALRQYIEKTDRRESFDPTLFREHGKQPSTFDATHLEAMLKDERFR